MQKQCSDRFNFRFFQYLNVPRSNLIQYHLNYTLYKIPIKCNILFKIIQNHKFNQKVF